MTNLILNIFLKIYFMKKNLFNQKWHLKDSITLSKKIFHFCNFLKDIRTEKYKCTIRNFF